MSVGRLLLLRNDVWCVRMSVGCSLIVLLAFHTIFPITLSVPHCMHCTLCTHYCIHTVHSVHTTVYTLYICTHCTICHCTSYTLFILYILYPLCTLYAVHSVYSHIVMVQVGLAPILRLLVSGNSKFHYMMKICGTFCRPQKKCWTVSRVLNWMTPSLATADMKPTRTLPSTWPVKR